VYAVQIIDETLFYLIARRCLQEDNNPCSIGLAVLLRQLSAHTALFPSPRLLQERIRSLQAAGVLVVLKDVPGASGTGQPFFSLTFQITPAGLDYIDRLCPAFQDQGEDEVLPEWD